MPKKAPLPNSKRMGKESKQSMWFITINSNVVDEDMKVQLRAAYEAWYDEVERHIKFRNKEHTLDLVDEISTREVAVERGGKLGRWHIHALLVVRHRSNIHLNLASIRSFFETFLKLSSLHLDVQYISDESFSIQKYIRKHAE